MLVLKLPYREFTRGSSIMYTYKRYILKLFFAFIFTISFLALIFLVRASAAADGIKYEFEYGTQNGANIYTDYTGTTDDGTPFDLIGATCAFIEQKGTSTSIDVTVDESGLYELIVRYAQPFDTNKKVQYLNVNGTNQGEVSFPYTLEWLEMSAGIVKLKSGSNNIQFESYWGYTFFDYLIVKTADENITNLQVSKTLVNSNATNETKSLMSYLVDVYGKHII